MYRHLNSLMNYFVGISCGNPANGTNALLSLLSNGTLYKDEVNYTCITGYEILSGSTSRTCQANGNWTGQPLECTGIYL